MEFLEKLDGINVVGINFMHCSFESVAPAVRVLKNFWYGVVGVYPHNGYWAIPEWISTEIEVETAEKYFDEWVGLGVDMIGGCCGTTPDLIRCFHEKRNSLTE